MLHSRTKRTTNSFGPMKKTLLKSLEVHKNNSLVIFGPYKIKTEYCIDSELHERRGDKEKKCSHFYSFQYLLFFGIYGPRSFVFFSAVIAGFRFSIPSALSYSYLFSYI